MSTGMPESILLEITCWNYTVLCESSINIIDFRTALITCFNMCEHGLNSNFFRIDRPIIKNTVHIDDVIDLGEGKCLLELLEKF